MHIPSLKRDPCLWTHHRCSTIFCPQDLAAGIVGERRRILCSVWSWRSSAESFGVWHVWNSPAIACAVQRRGSKAPQCASHAECANLKPEPIFLNSNFTQFIESHLGDKESFSEQVKMLKQKQSFKMFWGRADWYSELCFCSSLLRKYLYTSAF